MNTHGFPGEIDERNVISNTASLQHTWTSERVKVIEKDESIEFIYIETSNVTAGYGQPDKRVYKIVFSCKDGEWHKSDRICGTIKPAREETYIFNDLTNTKKE